MLVAQSHANVKIAGSYSGLLIGAVGKTHLDIEDLAIMRAMPDMTVLAPADATELVAMMDWANATDGPVYLRLVRDAVPDLFATDYTFTPGAIHPLRSGGDVALVSTGPQTGRVLTAADRWPLSGIEATVVHVPSPEAAGRTAPWSAAGPSPAGRHRRGALESTAASAVWSPRCSPRPALRRGSSGSGSRTPGASRPATTSC